MLSASSGAGRSAVSYATTKRPGMGNGSDAFVLTPANLATFAAYDFTHARITDLAEQGHLTGVAYIAGHKKVSTTDHCARPNRRAADRALEAVGPTGFRATTASPGTRRNRLPGLLSL